MLWDDWMVMWNVRFGRTCRMVRMNVSTRRLEQCFKRWEAQLQENIK